jgi:hypothetical protein
MSTDHKERQQINDGGAAFPFKGEQWTEHGMSLRDWLAGMALSGLLQNLHVQGAFAHAIQRNADAAYELADAMLAARAKEGT